MYSLIASLFADFQNLGKQALLYRSPEFMGTPTDATRVVVAVVGLQRDGIR